MIKKRRGRSERSFLDQKASPRRYGMSRHEYVYTPPFLNFQISECFTISGVICLNLFFVPTIAERNVYTQRSIGWSRVVEIRFSSSPSEKSLYFV